MKRKNSHALTVSQKAKLLREYGFAVAYGKRGKTSAQHKSAVARTWKKVSKYTDNKKQEFVFQSANMREKKILRPGLSAEQFTPKGFFLRKPRGARKAPRYEVRKDGTIVYTAHGPKGGKVTEEIHPIDPKLLTEDPPRAILALARRKTKVVLTVNGFDSSQTREYSLDALAFYIAQDLLPKFLDPNLDDSYAKLHGKQKRTIEDFSDIFHVKIIRHVKSAKTKTKNRRKRRRI